MFCFFGRSDKSSCSMSSLVPMMATLRRISAVRRCSSRGSDGGTDSLSAIRPTTSSTSRSASWNRFVHCSSGEDDDDRTSPLCGFVIGSIGRAMSYAAAMLGLGGAFLLALIRPKESRRVPRRDWSSSCYYSNASLHERGFSAVLCAIRPGGTKLARARVESGFRFDHDFEAHLKVFRRYTGRTKLFLGELRQARWTSLNID